MSEHTHQYTGSVRKCPGCQEARRFATEQDVLATLRPGEIITYSELLGRMKQMERPTAATGVVLERLAFRRGSSSELVVWREPTWDDEVAGGWTDGTLWIKRRPAVLSASPEQEGTE